MHLANLGVPVLDADLASRAVVAPGQPALAEIVAAFGAQMLAADGTLDRPRMRTRVFADVSARRQLEAILHPRIRNLLREQAQACTAPYCVLVIPLLEEARADYLWLDRVLVIDVPRATQIARLLQRPGIDERLAENMLAAQVDRAARLRHADDVVDNALPLAALHSALARLHRRYLSLAQTKAAN